MRSERLDGLRGIAALLVIFSHLAVTFRPQMYFGVEKLTEATWQTRFAISPFFVMINGSFAVYVFFVLSGYVIANSADRARTPLLNTIGARLVRLSVPSGISVIFAASLYNLQFGDMATAAEIVNHWWIKQVITVDGTQSWAAAMKDALGLYYFTGTSIFNGVLWTMQRELIGSLSIYILFYYFTSKFLRISFIVLSSALLFAFNLEPYYYICFSLGALFYLTIDLQKKIARWLAATVLVIGVFLGGKPFFPPPGGSFYDLPYRFFASFGGEMYVWTTAAALVVFGTASYPGKITVLENPIAKFLGRVSFAAYLLHFPILVAVMSNLFVRWGGGSDAAFAGVATVYLVVVYLLALGFTVAFDEPAVALSRQLRSAKATIGSTSG